MPIETIARIISAYHDEAIIARKKIDTLSESLERARYELNHVDSSLRDLNDPTDDVTSLAQTIADELPVADRENFKRLAGIEN